MIPALIEKLSALQGPSYAAEEAIAKALGEPWAALQPPPNWTASLDAAIALTERVLPGSWWIIAKGKMTAAEPLYGAQMLFGADDVIGEGEGQTPAIALVLATLRALEAKETTPEKADG